MVVADIMYVATRRDLWYLPCPTVVHTDVTTDATNRDVHYYGCFRIR